MAGKDPIYCTCDRMGFNQLVPIADHSGITVSGKTVEQTPGLLELSNIDFCRSGDYLEIVIEYDSGMNSVRSLLTKDEALKLVQFISDQFGFVIQGSIRFLKE